MPRFEKLLNLVVRTESIGTFIAHTFLWIRDTAVGVLLPSSRCAFVRMLGGPFRDQSRPEWQLILAFGRHSGGG